METELRQEVWYKITLSMGKIFTAFHRDGEFIFTDGSSKHTKDIIPFTTSISPCDPPGKVLDITDFLSDIEEE